MNIRQINIIILGSLAALCLLSCGKVESYPPEPFIRYEGFKLTDTVDLLGNKKLIGALRFSFIDGDGDLGIDEAQYPQGGVYNLFFTMFEKTEGVFVKVGEDKLPTPINYIIPYMERTGQNKTLKGVVQVDFEYFFFSFDTIRYDFYVVDRANNQSNIETTPELVLKL